MFPSRAGFGVAVGGLCALVGCGLGILRLDAQAPIEKARGILRAGVGDSNTDRRVAATAVLALMAKNSDSQAMAEKALGDPKPAVRAAAANALGEMQATGSIPALKNAIRDTDVTVVLASAHALYLLKDPAAYEVYYAILSGQRKSGDSLMDAQKKMLSDPKKMAQIGFEQGIGLIPFAGLGLSALGAVTKDDQSPVRAAAAKLLATDPDPRSGEALVTAAFDKSWIVRAAALDAIARRGDFTLGPRVEGDLDDAQYQVRFVAAATVLHLDDVKRGPKGK